MDKKTPYWETDAFNRGFLSRLIEEILCKCRNSQRAECMVKVGQLVADLHSDKETYLIAADMDDFCHKMNIEI